MKYLKWDEAQIEHLQPGARIYRIEGSFTWVARIGQVKDYAVYVCDNSADLDYVAKLGNKVSETEAWRVFPICVEAGLIYRN